MQYVQLGATGLRVSRICLGCLSYGTPNNPSHPWVLGEAEARPLLLQAFDAGINFFDTANRYSNGVSEEILGKVLISQRPREELVIASKVGLAVGDHANGSGLSRKHIIESIDATLRRLGTDYVDLYYVHRLDGRTPIEESLEALNDLVRAGKVLYLGCSSTSAYKFVQMREMQKRNSWAEFVAMQNLYNLCYREEEREMIPYCREVGVGLLPWSPLARGFLAGRPPSDDLRSDRSKSEETTIRMFGSEQDHAILRQVETVAGNLGVKPAQVALAWTLAKGVTAPIIGATKPHHIDDALGALDVELNEAAMAALEGPYHPRALIE